MGTFPKIAKCRVEWIELLFALRVDGITDNKVASRWDRCASRYVSPNSIMRTLLLEDDVYKHHAISQVLENKYGEIEIQIDWARNLEEGIDQIAKQAYDIIITDMYFPARAGEEDSNSGEILIRKIKDMNIHTPIILCFKLCHGIARNN